MFFTLLFALSAHAATDKLPIPSGQYSGIVRVVTTNPGQPETTSQSQSRMDIQIDGTLVKINTKLEANGNWSESTMVLVFDGREKFELRNADGARYGHGTCSETGCKMIFSTDELVGERAILADDKGNLVVIQKVTMKDMSVREVTTSYLAPLAPSSAAPTR